MATQAPEETDILCENCGYMLNGLPPSGNCPECGSNIDLSVSERFRQPCLWEAIGDSRPKWLRFLITTAQIIFRPKRFYRGSTSRGQVEIAYRFAQIHWIISAVLLGLAAWLHWESGASFAKSPASPLVQPTAVAGCFRPVIYLATESIIRLAARLTTWEAAYRGYRLPQGVVLRALYYHSAHLLPVALLSFVTCAGYHYLRRDWLMATSEPMYLYILCGEVIVAAGYLFNTYWIGMRNWMYANR